MTQYQPGVCNIGPSEISRRRNIGILGAVLTVLTILIFASAGSPRIYRLLVFIPAMIFATGFVQARKKFCLGFGISGVFNFGPAGKLDKVETAFARAQDRRTVIRIALQSLVAAAAITTVALLLPV
ncbi:MAG: hypothetical protein WCO85_00425 [Actinomycetes bacterium]|jgi:hypothetical protein